MKNLVDNYENNKSLYNLFILIITTLLDYIILLFVILARSISNISNTISTRLLKLFSYIISTTKKYIKEKKEIIEWEIKNWNWNRNIKRIKIYLYENKSLFIIGTIIILTIVLLEHNIKSNIKKKSNNFNTSNNSNNSNNSNYSNNKLKLKKKQKGGSEAPKPPAPKPEAPKPPAPKPEAPKPEAPKSDGNKNKADGDKNKTDGDKNKSDGDKNKSDGDKNKSDGQDGKEKEKKKGKSMLKGIGAAPGKLFGGVVNYTKKIFNFFLYIGITLLVIISPFFIYLVIIYFMLKKIITGTTTI
jgi:hypothetical protein